MSVGEGDERVKIVAFDENMVRSIRRRTYNRTLLDLRQDRNPLPLVLFGRLRLVFPDKTILFSLPQRINHLRLFLIAEPWGLQYARYQLLRVCVSHRDALQFMPARPTQERRKLSRLAIVSRRLCKAKHNDKHKTKQFTPEREPSHLILCVLKFCRFSTPGEELSSILQNISQFYFRRHLPCRQKHRQRC